MIICSAHRWRLWVLNYLFITQSRARALARCRPPLGAFFHPTTHKGKVLKHDKWTHQSRFIVGYNWLALLPRDETSKREEGSLSAWIIASYRHQLTTGLDKNFFFFFLFRRPIDLVVCALHLDSPPVYSARNKKKKYRAGYIAPPLLIPGIELKVNLLRVCVWRVLSFFLSPPWSPSLIPCLSPDIPAGLSRVECVYCGTLYIYILCSSSSFPPTSFSLHHIRYIYIYKRKRERERAILCQHPKNPFGFSYRPFPGFPDHWLPFSLVIRLPD